MRIKCNKCGYIGDSIEFPKGYDFAQKPFVKSCPKKCGNFQTPGDASMRMFGGDRPFVFVRENLLITDPLDKVLFAAGEAS